MNADDAKYLSRWVEEIVINSHGCERDRNEIDKVFVQSQIIQCRIQWIKEVLQDLGYINK